MVIYSKFKKSATTLSVFQIVISCFISLLKVMANYCFYLKNLRHKSETNRYRIKFILPTDLQVTIDFCIHAV